MEGTIGEVRLFGGNFAPRTWALCEGQLLAIASNTALFSIIGCTYGGDCRTSMALPDLRGRCPVGAGRGSGLSDRRLGARGGTETNTLNILNLPSHSHTASGTVDPGAFVGRGTLTNNPTGRYPAQTASGNEVYSDNQNTTMGTNNITVTIGNTGGNQSVNDMQPSLALHYIICMFGIFPSRN